MPGETSDKWHVGYGAGILLAPFNMATASLNYGISKEGGRFHIRINKRLRLLGIHAPEPEGERSTAGKTAAECLRKLIDAKNIIIRTAKGSDGADRDVDGRWLVVAYLDGLEVNDSMLSKAQLCRVVDPRRAATAMPERVLATWSDR